MNGRALAPSDDRYAGWPRARALWLLFALAAMLLAAALVPIDQGVSKVRTKGFVENIADNARGAKSEKRARDEDLALYDRAVARIRKGENYYDFIVAEHRRAHYPVRPGLAVRLPTLAYINAAIGEGGQIAAAIALMIAVLTAWWGRLGSEPGGLPLRVRAMALLFVGASLGVNRYFFQLHELWAGMLLALAFGLHRVCQAPPLPGVGDRPKGGGGGAQSGNLPPPSTLRAATSPGRGGAWVASLVVAALALAIREHALPFVLLMAATAFWRRAWTEGAAWTALAAVFLVALAVHLHLVAAQVLPSDPPSPSWITFRGLSGWLSNITLSSNLRFLPHWLAGPLIVLMVFGWSGWKTWAGTFGTLLYLGYGLLFLIAGRADNFYWGVGVAPAMFIGLAFTPRALRSLWRAAARA